jgi:hypothetical protein
MHAGLFCMMSSIIRILDREEKALYFNHGSRLQQLLLLSSLTC